MRTSCLKSLFFLFSFFLLSVSIVTVAHALPGDIDDSGRVDGFDLITFARAFNSTSTDNHWNAAADLNGDGTVNDSDLTILRNHFGQTGVSQNCWVADENNQEAVKLGGAGQEVFRSSTIGYTQGVWGNPVDSSAWVTEIANDTIIKFSASGEILKTISGFNDPRSITVDLVRKVIWVADKVNDRIVRISTDVADGYNISTDSGSHVIISGFSDPLGVSVNTTDGSCWVADTYNNRVVKLQHDTPDGYNLASDSGYHLTAGGFNDPWGVSVDNITGACWVADTYNDQIVKLSASGSEELRLGGFYYPTGVSVNPMTGNCWVADKNNDEIVKLSENGAVLKRIAGFSDPLSVAVDPIRGDCWVADTYHDQIVKLSPGGQELLRLSGFDNPAAVSAVPPSDGDESPTASASVSSYQADTDETLTFDGSPSTSTGHTIVRYQWDFDGDGTFDSDSSSPTATYSFSNPGLYSVTLKITNDIWLTDTTHSELIRVGSLTPDVTADPTTGTAPLSVTFTFDAIDPIDGQVEKFLWDFDGNGIFEQEYTSPGTASHTYSTPGTYTATVKILDTGNISITRQITITATQALPTATTNASATQGSTPLQVNFNGSGVDPDGTIVFYEWDFDGDATYDWFNHANGTASYMYSAAGSYNATIRVTDNDGNQANASETITVDDDAEQPTASFTATPAKGNTPITVNLNATASTIQTGSITQYDWDFGDSNTGSGSTTSHTYTQSGNYTVTLTVTGSNGTTDTATTTISVIDSGLPTAVADAVPTTGIAPLAVNLDASRSHDDPNTTGQITKYEWNFGDTGILMSDDMESGTTLWQADSPWAITSTDAHSGTYCWTDSPGGNYANNANTSLISSSFSLASLSPGTPTALKFWHHYQTESGYDEARVEISINGGTNWTQLTQFYGTQSTWTQASVDITTYAGESDVKVRFRLDPDSSVTYDGWYIDDVSVEATLYTEAVSPSVTPYTFSQIGTFTPELKVTDDDGNSDTDTVTITVTAGGPTAVASATPLVGLFPLTVDFDASGSSDPNGSIAKYEWCFEAAVESTAEAGLTGWNVDSSNPWGVTQSSAHSGSYSFTDSPAGDYVNYVTTSLTSDPFDLSGSTGTTLTFWHHYDFTYYAYGYVEISTDSGANWTELATYPYNSDLPDWTQESIDLSTYDGESSVLIRFRMYNSSYYNGDGWYVDDIDVRATNCFAETATPASTQHTFNSVGSYNPILRVTDNDGYTDTDQVSVSVRSEPTATINLPLDGYSHYREDVLFSGSGTDPDGTIDLYEWDFDGDGTYDWSSTSGADTIYSYSAAGSYNPVLRVTDNQGYTDTATISLTITETTPADFELSVDRNKGYAPHAVNLDGSATDADGSIVRYDWDFDNDGSYDWGIAGGSRVLSYSSQYNSSTWAADNLIDGGVGSSLGWASSYNAPFPHEIVFELPQAVSWSIDKLVIDPSTTDPADYWGKDFEVLYSNTDSRSASFTSLGLFTLANSAGGQTFNLPTTAARYLMIRVLSNYGYANYTELGEVDLYSGNINLLSPLSAETSHTFTTTGNHIARLRATDDSGNQTTDTISVAVLPDDFIFARLHLDPERGYNPLTVDFAADVWDDFSGNSLADRWTESFGSGTWVIENGALKQTNNNGSGDTADVYGLGLLLGSSGWSDYTLTADIYSTDNDNFGLIFRYQNDSSYYLFLWNAELQIRQLLKRTANAVTVLAQDSVPYNSNQWYTVRVDAIGSNLTVSIDDVQIFSVTDTDYNAGKAALWCNYNQQTWFDNIKVRQNGLTYAWDIDGVAGTDATTATTSHTYTEADTYPVSLTVSDGTTTDTAATSLIVKPQGEGFISAWVADTSNDKIVVLEPDGVTVRKQIYGFSNPNEIFADPAHNSVWVIDDGQDKIYRFDDDVPDSYNAITGDNYHAMSSGWYNPVDMDFTADGGTWIVDRDNDRIVFIPNEFSGYLPIGVTGSSPESTANGYTADSIGSPTVVAGQIGNAINFPGTTTEYVSLPYQAMSGLNDFTMEAWVKHDFTSAGGGALISGARNGVYNAFLVYLVSSTRVQVYIDNNYKYFDTTINMDNGQFHHVAVTRSGDQVSVYVDGVPAGTAQTMSNSTMHFDLGGFYLGQDQDNLGGGFSTGDALVGAIDDLRVWNTARSETDIANGKGVALTGNETGLVAYWPFDQIDAPRAPFKIISGFSTPREVAVNKNDGTIWVADSGHNKVFRFAASVPDGYDISTDTGSHTELTGFSGPWGIVVNNTDGTAWLADRYHDQVVHIAADGSTELSRIGGFNDPIFLDINQQDETVWVGDYYHDQVVHLAGDGSLELSRTGGFNDIQSLAVDSSTGQCWIADIYYEFVRRLAPDGTLLSSKGGFYNPYGIAVLSQSGEETAALPPQISSASSDATSGPEGTTINFTATATDNGSIVLYEWDFDGDNVFDYSGATGSTNHTYDGFGHFIPRVKVTDDEGLHASKSLPIITIGSTTAIIDAQPTDGYAPLDVTFTGSCFDPAGLSCTFDWDFGNGVTRTNDFQHTYRYNTAGLYRATLTATNTSGTVAQKTVLINVKPSSPTATASVDPVSGSAPLSVALNGSGSDPDGSIVRYQWDYDSDGLYDYSSTSSGNAFYIFTTPGRHPVTLKVTDDDGLTATAGKLIYVSRPPVIDMTITPDYGNAPLQVSFDASATSDNDSGDSIASYLWDFGDGVSATGAQVNHTYSAAGNYQTKLTVTDSFGLSSTETHTITVLAAGKPLAVASASPTSGEAPLTVQFSGDNSSDADGAISQYDWLFGDGFQLDANGYPTRQLFLGPWPSTGCGDLTSHQAGIENSLPGVGLSSNDKTWFTAIDTDGNFNWNGVFGAGSNVYAYSHIYVYSPTQQEVLIKFGADDAARLWVNGTFEFSKDTCEGIYTDKYTPQVTLVQGWNRILFSVSDGSGGWGLAYRITDLAGTPLQLDYSLNSATGAPDPSYSSVTTGNTAHTYTGPGTYEATLTVTDDQANQTSAAVFINVGIPNPPVATASAVATQGPAPFTAQFTGMGSDSDGSIVLYEWDFDGDGTYDYSDADSGVTNHTYTTTGSYDAVLRVTDNNGYTDTDTIQIIAGILPEARPYAFPLSGNAPLQVQFASHGFDADGTIELYEWDFDGNGQRDTDETFGDLNSDGWPDNPSEISTTFPYTYSIPGTYNATLTVIDNDGLSSSTPVTIVVGQPTIPIADITVDNESGDAPFNVTFNGYGSDYDGTIVSYEWDFGDSTTGSGQQVNHTYSQVGIYTATLTVTDSDSNTATATIHVRAREDGMPIAAALADKVAGAASFTVSFTGTGTDSNGTIMLYEWDFDGDGNYDYSSTSSGNVIHNYTEAGAYEAAFRVTDNDGRQDIDFITINVSFGINAIRGVEMFDPTLHETAIINYSLTTTADLTLKILDRQFNTVKTLFQASQHSPGAYRATWDGTDSNSQVVDSGVYYFVMDYNVSGQTGSLDLTGNVSLARREPNKTYDSTFNTLEDEPLFVKFSLSNPAETTIYIAYWVGGYVYVGDRVKTAWLRKPRPKGDYIVTWDGTDDEGNVAPLGPTGSYVWSVMAWDLPGNAIIVNSEPEITDVSKDPDFFMPAVNQYKSTPGSDLIVSFSLTKAATVDAFIKNENNITVRTMTPQSLAAGTNQMTWDGKDDSGNLVVPGTYRMGLRATDANGNQSTREYSLFRVFY